MKKDHGDGKRVHIVKGSPFLTIQGEGPYTGNAAVFVRLHGCHLRCTFCDTEFDDPDDPTVSIFTLTHDIHRAAAVTASPTRLVVITGGEPMRQNILLLCRHLKAYGFVVQIETAGTFWIDGIEKYAEIVCSPKTPIIHEMIYKHAKAFKYIINGAQEFNDDSPVPVTATQAGARRNQLALPRLGAPVYLSPCDEGCEEVNKANRRIVARLAIKFGCIAGLQLHKYMEVA
jgi:organic radical activating enzyme